MSEVCPNPAFDYIGSANRRAKERERVWVAPGGRFLENWNWLLINSILRNERLSTGRIFRENGTFFLFSNDVSLCSVKMMPFRPSYTKGATKKPAELNISEICIPNVPESMCRGDPHRSRPQRGLRCVYCVGLIFEINFYHDSCVRYRRQSPGGRMEMGRTANGRCACMNNANNIIAYGSEYSHSNCTM